ncbi:tyrosine-type recombinase/integrase [Mycobacterium neglectum]|uniref:tyrosine-type recombinase/integrase n=1 Tax=Mycobacterium neglectum TaxID=242737 RepID=UPI000BFEF5EE|nr:tyrosine-type recombinase/integrase [Mycobacterium neglectum]
MAQKKRGVWVARWHGPDGKQRSHSPFQTKKAAEAYEDKAKAAIAAGNDFDPRKGKMLFRDAAAIWLASHKENLVNHRSALAPAATRRGDGRTLGIDAVFGGYPLNKITREYIQDWVNRLTIAGKKPSTVRHAFFTVRMVLEQAEVDGRLAKNPAEHVKLPAERGTSGGKVGVVAKTQFLNPDQVAALEAATPWPYNVLVHLAAWSGLRAAELGGLQIADVELPPNQHATLDVSRTVKFAKGEEQYGPTKTATSERQVPLTEPATDRLREYLKKHPRRLEPDAPLFPAFTVKSPPTQPTGPKGARKAETTPEARKAANRARTARHAEARAALSVAEAEAQLKPDWAKPLRHQSFYKTVYRPAVLRANRLAGGSMLPPGFRFHSLRHSYASLCGSIGIPVRQVAEWMGHASATTTEEIYTHVYKKADYADEMAALGALATGPTPSYGGNVIAFPS